MRIGDWSSDVCSSDLERLPPRSPRTAPPGRPPRPGACRCSHIRPPHLLHGACGAAAVFAAHEVDGTSFTDISELIGVPRATLDYYFARKDDTLAFVLQSLVDDIARRSEEHTSELQSLM